MQIETGVKLAVYRREALSRTAAALTKARQEHGPRSVLYYSASGTKGLLNACGLAFWRLFGGCTTTYGGRSAPFRVELPVHPFSFIRLREPMRSSTAIRSQRPIRTARSVLLAMAFACLGTSAVSAQASAPARAVLVTGASSGIGLRMTEVLAANGFFVYAGARSADDLRRLDAMANVKAVRLDVTVQAEIDDAAELIRTEGRGLYGLVNNAGVVVVGPLIEMPEKDMAFQLDVNLVGPYRVTKAFAPLLIESRGRIMNTSSISGILSGAFLGAYSMSKHGVEAYTDALAAELAAFGVAVSAVEPGNYRSEIVASMKERLIAAGYTPENSRYSRSMLEVFGGPEDRSQFPEPDDVAMAALDFMTSETPKRRYLVVPNRNEAGITIRKAIEELVQLDQDHPFSFGREALIRMLDEALANGRKP